MDTERIQEDLRRILELLKDVPEPYKAKAFELLLSHSISVSEPAKHDANVKGQTERASDAYSQRLPKELRPFITRTGVSEQDILQIIDIERREIRQIPRTTSKAQGQVQTALLVALLTAATGGALEVDANKVREMCRSFGYYDEANFSSTFKKNSNLFIGPVRSNEPPRRLSLEGERQLAQLVRELVREYAA